jgi:hypothetical protein
MFLPPMKASRQPPLAAAVERPVGVDDHVPDLPRRAVRAAVQLAVDDQAAADPRRPGDVDHVPGPAPGAVVVLTEAGHVRVVGELDLRPRGAAHHRHEGHVLPWQVGWVDEDAALQVDGPGRRDGDAAHLLAPAVAVDLRGSPVDHVLWRLEQRRFRLDACHELAVRARERDTDLRSAEVDARQHVAR